MIAKIKDLINEYSNALIQANSVFTQAETHIKKNYIESSDLYTSAMKTAQEVKETAIRPILDDCKGAVKEVFEEVRNRISSAVAVAPSSDVMTILPLISAGKLNDTELQILVDAHKSSYLDSKLIQDAMGKGDAFTTVEAVLQDLDVLQAGAEQYFKTYHGEPMERMSYNNAMMMVGSIVEDTNEKVNSFLNTYGVQGSES